MCLVIMLLMILLFIDLTTLTNCDLMLFRGKAALEAEEIRLCFHLPSGLLTTGVPVGVVHSLSTNSFIMCLRRFITKRYKPTVICSYNGTNFVGSNLVLISGFKAKLQVRTLSRERIQMVFNPPGTIHMGE